MERRGKKEVVFQILCLVRVSVWTSYRVVSMASWLLCPSAVAPGSPFLFLCPVETGQTRRPLAASVGDGAPLCPGGRGQSAAVPPILQRAESGLSAGEGNDGDAARTVLGAARG